MLSEVRRKQLDDIVLKMANQDAPKEDVDLIVNDFLSKFGNEPATPPVQSKLQGVADVLNKPGLLKSASGFFSHTAKLVGGALLNATNLITSKSKPVQQMNQSNQNLQTMDETAIQRARSLANNGDIEGAKRLLTTVQSHGSNITLNDIIPASPTLEQTAGSMIGTAAELAPFSTAGASVASKVVKPATNFWQGAWQGAQAGAKAGALYGGAQGVSGAMEKNSPAGQVAFSGGLGGVAGGIGGAVVGGAVGGISGAIQGHNIAKQNALGEYISPKLTPSETAKAIKAGKATPEDMFNAAKINPNNQETQAAVMGVVDPKKGYVENVNNLRTAIGKEATGLRTDLQNNDVIFNKSQFQAQLKSIDPPLEVQADPIVEKKYQIAMDKFMQFVDDNPKNLSGLLNARQQFDQWAQMKIPKIWNDPTTVPINTALRQMRNATNDFIEEKLPTDALGDAFRASLRKQTLMYDTMDNLADKAVKTMAKTGFELLMRAHPMAKNILGGTGLAGAAYGAYELVGKPLLSKIKENL
jgi:hypothetical protein